MVERRDSKRTNVKKARWGKRARGGGKKELACVPYRKKGKRALCTRGRGKDPRIAEKTVGEAVGKRSSSSGRLKGKGRRKKRPWKAQMAKGAGGRIC